MGAKNPGRVPYGTKKEALKPLFYSGANGNRTSDTRIFSPLLYQLSYGTPFDLTPDKLRTGTRLFITKAGAKVLLFFDIRKFFCIFFVKDSCFLAKTRKKRYLCTRKLSILTIMELKVIAIAHNGHTDKFGIPRQSREDSPVLTRIVLEPTYSVAEAFRGIDQFSHVWLVWGFSENESKPVSGEWSPTVRPPRLGGNKRMGVFATRSPFRPNPLGLTSVKLIRVEKVSKPASPENPNPGKTIVLVVSGADLLDGTPIYDIKPYLSFTDCHPDAQNGFAERTKDYKLTVRWPEKNFLDHNLDKSLKRDFEYILAQDPRPAYHNNPAREYKVDYAGWRVRFKVKEENDSHEVFVTGLERVQNETGKNDKNE